MKKLKKLIAFISVLAIVLWAGYRFWYALMVKAVEASDTSRVIVTIPAGASTNDITEMLEEQGLIKSGLAFKVYVKKSGNAGKLQAGSFVLMRSMSADAIVTALMSGKTEETVITVPEGYTVKDIDALLVERGLIEPGELTECARTCDFSDYGFLPPASGLADRGGRVEGYLYPDTYFIATETFDVQSFIERLLSTFRTRVIDELGDEIAGSKRTLHEVVTMASLIEEETRTNGERAVVSGILWKRFDEGMGLGVDAAVRYIINKPTAAITSADLNTDSAYNLRKYRGLPPGPIASPGLQSIEAAIRPEISSYYYYLHGNDGVIRYAATNDEHNLNKAKYLR